MRVEAISTEELEGHGGPDTQPRGLAGPSVYCCALLIWTVIARVQEVFVGLQVVRPALLAFVLTLGLSLLGGRLTRRPWLRLKETRLLAAFWLLAGFSIPFAVWRGGAFNTWLYGVTGGTVMYFCCLQNTDSFRELRVIFNALAWSTAILAAGAILSPSGADRISATQWYDANDFAFVLACLLPLVFSRFVLAGASGKLVVGTLLVLIVLLILRTGSRGGFLGLCAFGGCILVTPFPGFGPLRKTMLLTAIAVAAIAQNPEMLWQRFAALLQGQDYNLDTEGFSGRLAIWTQGLSLVAENPVLGVGAGQFATSLGQRFGPSAWMTAHNSFIQVGAELGVPALLVYVAILVRIWKNSSVVPDIFILQREACRSMLHGVRHSLVVFLVCGSFLSQAYSPIVPILLCLSFRLREESSGFSLMEPTSSVSSEDGGEDGAESLIVIVSDGGGDEDGN